MFLPLARALGETNKQKNLIRQVELTEGEVCGNPTQWGKNHAHLAGKVMLHPVMNI